MATNFLMGIDLGGSKIYTLIVSPRGEIVGRSKSKTPQQASFGDIVQTIKDRLDAALAESGLSMRRIHAVGMGVPGPVDSQGRVAVMPNLGLENVPVAKEVSAILGKPVHVENDVNLATLAEFRMGAGQGLNSLYGIFPGTGVGGGYVVNGKIVKGKNNTAGEIGHMVVQIDGPLCGCGQRGCLEAFASRTALVRDLQAARGSGENSVLMEFAHEEFRSVGAQKLREAWNQGDLLVRRLLTKQAGILGVAVANIVNLVGVDGVVVGGGVYEALGEELLPIVADTATEHAIGGGMAGVRLALSKLKENAVAVGATLVAKEG